MPAVVWHMRGGTCRALPIIDWHASGKEGGGTHAVPSPTAVACLCLGRPQSPPHSSGSLALAAGFPPQLWPY